MTSRSIFGAVLLGALMVSQSASALSCMQPDLVKTLEAAKASPKTYHILVGNFTSLTPGPAFKSWMEMPPEDQRKSRPPRIMSTVFEGYSLAGNRRHDVPLSRFPVDVEVSCAGQWCSDVPSSDRSLIAFVEAREGQAPLLKYSPCPNYTFYAGTKQVQKTRQCLDKTCGSDDPDW